MGDVALSINHLYKDFRLPHQKKNSLKEHLLNFHRPSYDKLHALSDINLEIKRGEFFGIVGRNGSGKSTLLKIIGGIYQPTKGSIQVNGTLTPFIELGIGFNPELTGRENVYLNGAILGLTHKEVVKKYNEIVDFAEIEKFMDQKLKNYSSGMQVRLAFSIAIQAHNDILLIDEVLAVGDANFQRKCFQVFKQIKKSGRTVIFVTHDMGAVQEYCDRAMMIQDSEMLIIGKPREVALRYEVANTNAAKSGVFANGKRPEHPAVRLIAIRTENQKAAATNFALDEDIVVSIDYESSTDTPVQFNVNFVRSDGLYVSGINTTKDLGYFVPTIGRGTVTCSIKAGQLARNDYLVNSAVYTYSELESPELIDIMDANFGVKTPRITILDASTTHNGEFYIQGKWSKPER